MGNKSEASIEAIGCFSLELSSGFKLLLDDTIYVPSMSRNLISLSKLDSIGFSVTFGNGCFSLFKDNNIVGSGILENGMYRIELDKSFSDSLFISLNSEIGVKRVRSNENSAFLWHKRLAHISRERMMLLVKDNILPSLDFNDFGTCDGEVSGRIDEVIINEIREETSVPISVPLISTHEVLFDTIDAGEQREDDEPQPINVTPAIPEVIEAADTPIAEVPVRRSTRPRRSAISDDYMWE
ncbi:hypothetical protein V2J09_013782 [Rumex salicifolius]